MRLSFMRSRMLMLVLVFLLMRDALCQMDAPGSRCAIIQLPNEAKLKDHIYEDINQDGLKDLALSVGDRNTTFTRSLRIHYQRNDDQAFVSEPDVVVSLTPDVIAYAFADTDPQPGEEVLLFTASACFGYRLQEERSNRVFKIMDCEFLWQLPDKDHVFSWQHAVLDLDGDGRTDVFLPQSGGFRMLLQKASGFVLTPLLTVPKMKKGGRTNGSDQVSVGVSIEMEGLAEQLGIEPQRPPLVNETHAVDVPLFTDFNGDHRDDVLTQTSTHLHIWQQGGDAFQEGGVPLSLALPLDDSGDRDIISMRRQYVLDLDRDGRCDCILVSRVKNSKRLATHLLIYLNRDTSDEEVPLFGKQGVPNQLLKIAGLPSDVQLQDINGDGYPDLCFLTFRPDLLDQVKTLASQSIRFQCLAFLNDGERFSGTPDMMQDVYVSVSGDGGSENDQGRFFVDYNGDRLLDCLVRDSKRHVGLRLLRKTDAGMAISEPFVWEMAIPEDGRMVYEKAEKDHAPVLLIVGSQQVMHVSFQ